jgi:hypothetical protein
MVPPNRKNHDLSSSPVRLKQLETDGAERPRERKKTRNKDLSAGGRLDELDRLKSTRARGKRKANQA